MSVVSHQRLSLLHSQLVLRVLHSGEKGEGRSRLDTHAGARAYGVRQGTDATGKLSAANAGVRRDLVMKQCSNQSS